ncbi:Smr/MutS family protein [Mycoplasmopsis lipofaciens]|uniref:Smr/MutS family protein n=1 Tax=Mycoplasmopsis lipofaciens TaxID=114884 RepID=UPI000484A70C|nr:Smr/MutS family protein [Mycoplasmopsis lipofaciens]
MPRKFKRPKTKSYNLDNYFNNYESYINQNMKIIDLHGLTVSEAISQLELALFDFDKKEIGLIVGHGTGTIKTAIEDELIKKQLCYSFDSNRNMFIIKK